MLLENKSILILNQNGKSLALFSNFSFTALTSSSEYLYVSTSEGNLIIYNIRSYSVYKELPATHNSLIKNIKVNTGNLVYVLFEDATVQILNLAEGQVANQSSGHSLPINSLV